MLAGAVRTPGAWTAGFVGANRDSTAGAALEVAMLEGAVAPALLGAGEPRYAIRAARDANGGDLVIGVERTVGAAAALNDELGFLGAAEVAQEAIRSGRTVAEVMAQRRR